MRLSRAVLTAACVMLVPTGLAAVVPDTATAASPALQTFQTPGGAVSTTDVPTVGTGGGNAGYLGNTSTLSKLGLHLTVRKVSCTKSPTAPIFVEVAINGTLVDRDFGVSGMYIGESCTGTTPNYGATLVVDGITETTMTVSPGDVLSFTGSVKKKSESYTMTDITTSQSVSDTGTGLSPRTSSSRFRVASAGTPTSPRLRRRSSIRTSESTVPPSPRSARVRPTSRTARTMYRFRPVPCRRPATLSA